MPGGTTQAARMKILAAFFVFPHSRPTLKAGLCGPKECFGKAVGFRKPCQRLQAM